MKKLLLFAALLAATSGIAQVTNTRNQASGPQEAMPFPATSLRATSDSLEAASEYAGGSGTEADPYLIETPEQFMKLAQDATGDGIETYLLKGVYFKHRDSQHTPSETGLISVAYMTGMGIPSKDTHSNNQYQTTKRYHSCQLYS